MTGLMDEKILPISSLPGKRQGLRQWSARLWNPRRNNARPLMWLLLFTLIGIWYWMSKRPSLDDIIISPNGFKSIDMVGYVNVGAMEKHSCDEIRHQGQIGVEQSFDVHDDLLAIANELDDHPMIDYSGQDKSLTHEEIVKKTWLRMAQSSVWLEKYQVYFTVTRVLFYDKGVRNWPVISFIRGQIHDRNWKELKQYVLHWQGRKITFPLIFDIPSPFNHGGGFYGPEDPRVIIEQNQPDAEPVIIFNMISSVDTLRRSMYMYRPFSDKTLLLGVRGRAPNQIEKNWMPFFYDAQNEEVRVPGPNRYIHFVYDFRPLSIIKCRLQYGWCDVVYYEQIPDEHRTAHNDSGGVLRGGSNFYPVTLAHGKQSFVGFPRTHVDRCNGAYYRPELVVLSAISDTKFHLDYLSGPLDFGDAVIDHSKIIDTCVEGRILIANSISNWDQTLADDAMTLSVTVDDYTTQVVRIHGVRPLLKSLPRVTETHEQTTPLEHNLPWSIPGQDVIGCCIELAVQGATAAYQKSDQYRANELTRLEELRKAEAAKAEEERKSLEQGKT